MPQRSFMSPGEINYRRHKGRHEAEAFRRHIHHDLAHLVKHTGKKNPRWLCHLCQVQCLDAADFKKHIFSPRHVEAIDGMTDEEFREKNSWEFEANFMSRLEKTNSVNTNADYLYEEMLQSTRHVRIEDTKWGTLRDFLHYLQLSGKATVKGVTVRPGGTPVRLKNQAKKKKTDGEHLQAKMFQESVVIINEEAKKKLEGIPQAPKPQALQRGEEKIAFSFAVPQPKNPKNVAKGISQVKDSGKEQNQESSALESTKVPETTLSEESNKSREVSTATTNSTPKKRKSLDLLPFEKSNPQDVKPKKPVITPKKALPFEKPSPKTETEKLKKSIKAPKSWIMPGLIVKCLAKGEYYKQKGEIVTVSGSQAKVKMPDGESKTFEAEKLETVIPALGKQVKIVTLDSYFGQVAELQALNETKNRVTVRILGGDEDGKLMELEYEGICKFN